MTDYVLAYKLIKLKSDNKRRTMIGVVLGDWCHTDSIRRYSPHLGEEPPKLPPLIDLHHVIENLPTGSIIEIKVPDDH